MLDHHLPQHGHARQRARKRYALLHAQPLLRAPLRGLATTALHEEYEEHLQAGRQVVQAMQSAKKPQQLLHQMQEGAHAMPRLVTQPNAQSQFLREQRAAAEMQVKQHLGRPTVVAVKLWHRWKQYRAVQRQLR